MEPLVSEYSLPLSLKISLVYCLSTTLSLTSDCFSSVHSPSALSHYAHGSVYAITVILRSYWLCISPRFYTAFLFTDCFFLCESSTVCSLQFLNSPNFLRTCQALPLKGVHFINHLPPSFLQFPIWATEVSALLLSVLRLFYPIKIFLTEIKSSCFCLHVSYESYSFSSWTDYKVNRVR